MGIGIKQLILVIVVFAIFAYFVRPHLSRLFGRSSGKVLRGMSVREGAKADGQLHDVGSNAIFLGGVPLTSTLEAQHLLFAGTTGSGKTQGIDQVLTVVRNRGSRAIVADAGGESLSRFFREGDILINPFDQRSAAWSPFAEIRDEYDCARIARAAIPDGEGELREWHHYAQTLVAETLLAMHKLGLQSVKQLLQFLTVEDAKVLGAFVADTPAAMLCRPENEKMLGSTRAIVATFLASWRYLPDTGTFSIREWIRNDGSHGWLYITYRDDQFGMLRFLIATLLEIALVEGLSLPENADRDLWVVMDEVDSLGKINSLGDALSKLRKHGCKCILGLQTVSQLTSTYGQSEAQTLLANISTKVILRAGDGETAEYFSKDFGEQLIERVESSSSSGLPLKGDTRSKTTREETRRTVMGSEISSLANLHGYLKIPPGRLILTEFEYMQYPKKAPDYVPRTGKAVSSGAAPAAL